MSHRFDDHTHVWEEWHDEQVVEKTRLYWKRWRRCIHCGHVEEIETEEE